MNNVQNQEITPIPSYFNLWPVVFDMLSFERHGFRGEAKEIKTEFRLSYAIKKITDTNYCVTLRATATRKEEYTATVQISGYCNFDEALPKEADTETLLKENALAILFPYIRSQMTLLTAQPEVEPIVWPVMNILEMLKKSDE